MNTRRSKMVKGDAMEQTYNFLVRALESVVLAGAAMSALFVGVRSVYRQARNIEKLVELSGKSAEDRKAMALELANFRQAQAERDALRDSQIAELQNGVALAVRELTPNGGSSIKDVVNNLRIDVARLTQWKEDQVA